MTDDSIKMSFVEVYNDKIIDLLAKDSLVVLTIKEFKNRFYVENLEEVGCPTYHYA